LPQEKADPIHLMPLNFLEQAWAKYSPQLYSIMKNKKTGSRMKAKVYASDYKEVSLLKKI